MTDVRRALRTEFESRGLDAADDTVASRGEPYVKGYGDLAAGLFEFEQTAREAIDAMYQGHWTEGLPPRFAVLPSDAANEPTFDMLEQMRIIPVLYETSGESVTFLELDAVLRRLRA